MPVDNGVSKGRQGEKSVKIKLGNGSTIKTGPLVLNKNATNNRGRLITEGVL